jgi:hypothetical protein
MPDLDDVLEWIWGFFLGLLMLAVVSIILAFPVMLSWNLVIPRIFHLPDLNYLEALSFFILFKLVLGVGVQVSKTNDQPFRVF